MNWFVFGLTVLALAVALASLHMRQQEAKLARRFESRGADFRAQECWARARRWATVNVCSSLAALVLLTWTMTYA